KRLAVSGADNFADAKDMEWMAVASNVNATKESGERNHAGNPGGKSLWWRGTAIEDGCFAFDTHGSDFDTLLSVYTGSNVAALTKIAENDNDWNDGTSGVTFYVEKGKTYYFVVDGNEGASGNILLNWRLAYPPTNDNFANATALDEKQRVPIQMLQKKPANRSPKMRKISAENRSGGNGRPRRPEPAMPLIPEAAILTRL
ncbi:MAG: hypothetical protein BWK80_55685, partial [Desulfobacteraceae bacterium IS3]